MSVKFEFELDDAGAENLIDCIEERRLGFYLQAIDPTLPQSTREALLEASQYLLGLKHTVAKGSKRVTR